MFVAAVYVISGSGYSLQWDVEAEIEDQYHARIAKEPTRWEFSAGDLVYVPQNTVHQQWSSGTRSEERRVGEEWGSGWEARVVRCRFKRGQSPQTSCRKRDVND